MSYVTAAAGDTNDGDDDARSLALESARFDWELSVAAPAGEGKGS